MDIELVAGEEGLPGEKIKGRFRYRMGDYFCDCAVECPQRSWDNPKLKAELKSECLRSASARFVKLHLGCA